MKTVHISFPLTTKQASNVAGRTLDARLAAIALWHERGFAEHLEAYDATPSHYAVFKGGDRIVYRVVLDKPLSKQDEHFEDTTSHQLLFLLRGIDFNSKWNGR